jgi:tetratricopeptide (TPR) repeat protein
MKKKLWVVVGVVVAAGLFTGCLSTGNVKKADRYYKQGNTASNNKDWKKAIAEYAKAIRRAPKKEAYNMRGWAYLAKGDTARAEQDFNEALRIDPFYENAKDGLRHVRAPHAAYLLYVEGGDAIENKDYDLAIEKYSRAIALFPDYATVYNNRGVMYLRKKLYDEAEADFKKAVEIDPEHVLGYSNLGTVYKDRGEYDTAEQYLNRALEINPTYTYAKNELEKVTDTKAAAAKAAAKKEAWDRRVAATSYPAPFNGIWINEAYAIPAKYETRYRARTRTYTSPRHISDGYYDAYGKRWVNTSRTVTETRTETYQEPYSAFTPEINVPKGLFTLEFNGKSFVSNNEEDNTTRGTFYYNGDRIELEDGTVLSFAGGVITDNKGRKYTKQ